MPKKLPDNWGERDPLKKFMQASTDPNASAPSALDLIRSKQKEPRGRDWEKRHRAFSYKIPVALRKAATQVREDILSIAQFDESGNPRANATTAEDIARILLERALFMLRQNPNLLAPRPNALSRRGQMTVSWEAWDRWEKNAVSLKPPLRRQKLNEKKVVLTFRWGAELDAQLKSIAGSGTPGKNSNPLKFAVPVGDLVVRLLQIAIDDYKAGRFKFKIGLETVAKANSWELR